MQAEGLHQRAQILVANMAAVFAQMRGDTVHPGLGSQQGGAHRIGVQAAARIADRGDVIDVEPETGAAAHGVFLG
jgi:hypothetical protein